MKTLISNPKFISSFPSLPHNNHTFLNFKITKPIPPHPSTTSCSCSTSTDHGGWADLISTSNSTESTHLNRLLSSLGIDEKKYTFVYLFGFVCALGFSRVRVSSIVVFPACFLVFAVGFSFGVVNRWDFNEVLSNSGKKSKKKGVIKDEEFRVLSEGLRSLVDLFDGFGLKFGSLKESMRKDVDCNRVSKSDLVGYIESVESIEEAIVEAKSMIEGYMVVDGNDVSKSLNHKPSDQTKKPEGKGFDISRLIAGFQERSFGSKVGKMKDTVKSDRNQEKVVDPVVEDKTMKSVNGEDKSAYNDGDVRVKETYGGKTIGRMGRMTLVETEADAKQVFDTDEYVFKDNKARFYDQRRTKGYYEREQQDYGKYNRTNMLYDDLESSENEGYENENIFDESPSSEISSDVLFNDYLTEANGLLKQAREWLTHRGIEEDTEQMLYKSTELLSKAVDMKPMSLLAVGQLGNTYLLHGELKLKLSRKLRALLAESDSNVIGRLDDEVSNREKFVDYLVNVCEECEELLVKAGRKYRLALSIDGDDMRALYNWGLALSFRAQLIADIGPEAAFDADKVYLAAIDKFNAMMSRSNAHTPDALFRWGVALQQRSRLRTRNYREKVKLLSQAKRLYEDALLMDSNNPQVKQALMTCESELRYKNRF
ncbi:putative tetratricopeptide-like helical domain superfamily [Helianthus annuus]|nr:putative tetratricopeptide-like helical domain superfamily [Helianthus annuus]